MTQIWVEGNIASGKTTFLQKLQNYVEINNLNIQIKKEPIEEWCIPFKLFSNNKITGAELQTIIQNSLLKREKELVESEITFLERSLEASLNVFAPILEINKKMTQEELESMKIKEKKRKKSEQYNNAIILYIKTPVDICLKRVIQRNQTGDQLVSKKYLQEIHEKHENWMKETKRKIIVVHGENLNFDIDQILKKIKKM